MKVSNVQSFQSFNGIKDKFKTHKLNKKPQIDFDKHEYYNKYVEEDIRTGTIASAAAAAVLLAGVLGSGIALHSARKPVNPPEVSKIPSDVADSSYADMPSQQESDMFYVDNKFDVKNKTNPTDKYESEAKSDSDDEVVVEPALEEGKAPEQEAKVEQEVSQKSKKAKETEDVEYIEESEVIDEPEDVEYIYEPENSNPFVNNNFINPEIGLAPQFPPPYVWNPEISDGNEINESKMEFKSPFDGKTVKETGRDEVAGSVLFDDGSILVEKSGILYSANGMYVDFNEYMEEGEGMPVPIHVSKYNTDSFVFDDIKIGDETFYPIGMTEDGNVKFNDGSIVDVKTGLVIRTNGSVYHYITGYVNRAR